MRLTEQEISGIITGFEKFLSIEDVELRLYGSRIDDAKKGGDIDLLLIVPGSNHKEALLENKHKILTQIKQHIGERKIDLLICEKKDLKENPFLELIFPSSVLLKQW